MVAGRVLRRIDRLILRLWLRLGLCRCLLQLLELLGEHVALGLELGRLRHVVLPLVPLILQRTPRHHRLARAWLRRVAIIIRLDNRRLWRPLGRLCAVAWTLVLPAGPAAALARGRRTGKPQAGRWRVVQPWIFLQGSQIDRAATRRRLAPMSCRSGTRRASPHAAVSARVHAAAGRDAVGAPTPCVHEQPLALLMVRPAGIMTWPVARLNVMALAPVMAPLSSQRAITRLLPAFAPLSGASSA